MATRLTSRLSAGAALVTGLGMMGIATAVPAQADVTRTLEYSCSVTDLGITFTDPWVVDLTIGTPEQVEPGAEIPAPSIEAAVTPGADAQGTMRALGIQTLEGTSTTSYTFNGEERTAELTVPETAVPAEGTVTTVATGTGQAETAPTEPGEVPITAGDFTAQLTTDTGFVLNLGCTAPADNTVGAITVADPEPTDPEPTDPEPTDPTPTDPEPTDPTQTDPEPTDPEPADPTDPEPTQPADPAEPEIPEVVQTDGLTPAMTSSQDDSPAALALGGLLLAGAGAGTVLVVRRRAAQH